MPLVTPRSRIQLDAPDTRRRVAEKQKVFRPRSAINRLSRSRNVNVRLLPDIPGACYLGDVIRICPCRDALILNKHVCITRQSATSPRLLGRHYRILHPRAIPRRFVGTYHHPQIATSRSLNTLGRGSLCSFF